MSAIEGCLERAERYASRFDEGDLAAAPAREIAVLTCMDARLDPAALLGFEEGDAHVIRNAGGIVTEDVLRSLSLSQCVLGTREVMVIQHTRCGLLASSDKVLADAIERAVGVRPPFALESFEDLEAEVRGSLARLRGSPLLPHRDAIRGFVYDVETGRLREVSSARGEVSE